MESEPWIIATIDIEKAFLQGLSYEEIHARTKEPLREEYFTLPPGSADMLRKVKGFEHFDERRHVLKYLVPGTGTGDAPRAFSMKLADRSDEKRSKLQNSHYRPRTVSVS